MWVRAGAGEGVPLRSPNPDSLAGSVAPDRCGLGPRPNAGIRPLPAHGTARFPFVGERRWLISALADPANRDAIEAAVKEACARRWRGWGGRGRNERRKCVTRSVTLSRRCAAPRCSRILSGRGHALTCSARCRQRLARWRKARRGLPAHVGNRARPARATTGTPPVCLWRRRGRPWEGASDSIRRLPRTLNARCGRKSGTAPVPRTAKTGCRLSGPLSPCSATLPTGGNRKAGRNATGPTSWPVEADAAADPAERVAVAKTAREALKALEPAQPYTVDAATWDPGEAPEAVVSVTTSGDWAHPAMRRGEVAALGGAGGSGKSYLALVSCPAIILT